MYDFAAALKENPNGVLATQEDGQKTRVFQYLFSDGGQGVFLHEQRKPVYKQIKANPLRCFFAPIRPIFHPSFPSMEKRFCGRPCVENTRADENPGIKGIYKAPG